MNLTPKGIEQAKAVGKELMEKIGNQPVKYYVSTFWRTRQTYEFIGQSLPARSVYYDPRLREQEWGHLQIGTDYNALEDSRDAYGHFYYRFPDGESCADVFDRSSSFLNTFYRDVEKTDFPSCAVFVTHGMTARVILMRWFHLSVEEFELLANPKNCGYYILILNPKTGKYELAEEPRKRPIKHNYQYKSLLDNPPSPV
jgi:broad specificity phosphatase PhoE